nr:Heat shock protein Hsp20 domain containing protein [Haemonchus contortus]
MEICIYRGQDNTKSYHNYKYCYRRVEHFILYRLSSFDDSLVSRTCRRFAVSLRIANDAQNVVDDDKKFAVTLDVSQFKPEELTVNLEGRRLTVEGKQEQKNDNSFMSTTFIRSWTLPEDVDLEGVKSELDDKGKLTIEGALVAPVAIVGVEVTID